MAEAGTSVQPDGVFHLICGGASGPGDAAAVMGAAALLSPPCPLQTAVIHFIKSPFCASVSSALPRILKNKVEDPALDMAGMMRSSLAAAALFGKALRST